MTVVTKSNTFLKSVSVLVGGTVIAQAIVALVLPITSRLYTPGDFSTLSVFTGLVSIVSVAACLRFDVAVSLPQHDDDAVNILSLALICALAVSTVLAIFVFTMPAQIAALFNQPQLARYLWLLPVAVMMTSAYSALQMWFIRKKTFGLICQTRIVQSCAGAGTQVSFGWFGWVPFGLILGQALISGAGCVGLGFRLFSADRKLLKTICWSRMREVFSTYDRFPKYSTLEAVSNSAAIYLPVIMIAAMAIGPEAGYLTMAMFALQAPMGLIGTAVSQVYLSRAPDEHRAQNLGVFTANVIGGLVKSGVGPLIFAGIVAPSAFSVIFGDGWERAGVLVAWMTPWFILQFLASTVSMALHVTGNQKSALNLQLFGLMIRVGAVYVASLVNNNYISETYALSGFVFYFSYFIVVMRAVHIRWMDVSREVNNGIFVVLCWTLAGCAVSLSVKALTAWVGW